MYSRRQFGIGLGAMAVSGLAGASQVRKKPRILAWLRLNKSRTKDGWKRRMEALRKAGVDEVVVQAFPSSHALYASRIVPVKRRELERLVPAARAQGMAVHAWMHVMRCNVERIAAEHPDWFGVSREGKSTATDPPYTKHYKFLCPTRPEPRAFLGSIAAELAGFEGIAGVHLDFIRHPDVFLPPRLARKRGLGEVTVARPEFDFCYCEVCRQAFEAAHGTDPLKLKKPATDPSWERFRLDTMTAVVTELKAAARRANAQTRLTAAVFPTPTLARRMVRQDWDRWPLDGVMPMIYQRGYDQKLPWIETASREGVTALAGRNIPLYAGLLLSSFPAADLPKAIQYAMKGGAAGVCLFNLRDKHLPLLRPTARRRK